MHKYSILKQLEHTILVYAQGGTTIPFSSSQMFSLLCKETLCLLGVVPSTELDKH